MLVRTEGGSAGHEVATEGTDDEVRGFASEWAGHRPLRVCTRARALLACPSEPGPRAREAECNKAAGNALRPRADVGFCNGRDTRHPLPWTVAPAACFRCLLLVAAATTQPARRAGPPPATLRSASPRCCTRAMSFGGKPRPKPPPKVTWMAAQAAFAGGRGRGGPIEKQSVCMCACVARC